LACLAKRVHLQRISPSNHPDKGNNSITVLPILSDIKGVRKWHGPKEVMPIGSDEISITMDG
jgi:hypothetical protein